MLLPTHLVFAQTTFITTCILTGHAITPLESSVSLAASTIADIDSRQSYIGRTIHPVSTWIEDSFGHRTITHSLFAQSTIGTLAFIFLPFGFFLAVVTGWISHTIADMMTPSGVCWFWPNRARCVIPGNSRYRMESMGKGELWFLVIIALVGVVIHPLAQSGKNTTGLIRSAIGDVSTARKDYDAKKGEYAFQLEIKGRDNQTHSDVSGTYPVIGPFGESGFLIETSKGMRSACKTSACDWYADHSSLIQGKRERTTSATIHHKRIAAISLLDSLSNWEKIGKVYLLGEFNASGIPTKSPGVEVSGRTVILHYASSDRIRDWGSRILFDVHLTVQLRHSVDAQVPELEINPGNKNQSSQTDHLKKWLK